MFSLKEYREPTNRLPDYLPWAKLVAPGVVAHKEAVLQKTIAYRGPDLASSSDAELISGCARLNNALKRLGSGWAIFSEAQRFESNDYPHAVFKQPAAWLVDYERRRQFEAAGSHYESCYFLTFTWRLPSDAATKVTNAFYDDPARPDAATDNARYVESFQAKVREIVDIMKGVYPDVAELDDDQAMTYLHSAISTNRHPVKSPEIPIYLDALLPDQAFTPGDICMLGDSFIPTITFTGFPTASFPGILDALNHLQVEYRWMTRFICYDREDAKKELERYRKRWWQKRKSMFTMLKEEATKQESALLNTEAGGKAADAEAALVELGEDLVAFGQMTSTVVIWHRDLEEARRRIAAVKQVIQQQGFTVRDESLNGKEAWLGSLPGHVYANVRRPLVNTLNLAHIMPMSAIWSGDLENEHLKKETGYGAAHLYTDTTGSTPFRLNLNLGDVGHTLIVGPTGAGKSTLLAALEMAWPKYPNAQVMVFDMHLSGRATMLALGGTIYEPGSDRAPVAFQPFAHIDDHAERLWAQGFVETMLECQKVTITPLVKRHVQEAMENLATRTVEHRTLTIFSDLVQDESLREALRPYTLAGTYGQLFDADHDDLKAGQFTLIEMGHLMELGEDAILPALDYLFHRVEQRFDGRPTLLVLDEAWLFLAHPVFMRRLRKWLKTLRKKNVYVVFATQEVEDVAKSPIRSTILSACHTKIFLADPEALGDDMKAAYMSLGLSEREVQILAGLTKKQDYYFRSPKGRRVFDLNLGPVALAFAGASSPKDQAFMDRMIQEVEPKGYAAALLRYKRLDWAAELIEQASGVEQLRAA